MVDRIKQIIEYVQMSPTAFADTIGINRSSLAHIFSGRNQPSLDVAKKILTSFPEISTEWLIMGVGLMIKDPAEVAAESQKKSVIQTNLFEMEDNEREKESKISDDDLSPPLRGRVDFCVASAVQKDGRGGLYKCRGTMFILMG